MIQKIKPFGGPVDAIQELLHGSFEREYSGLSELCGLVQASRPKKIVKVGGINSSATAAVLQCMEALRLPCQLHVVDPMQRRTFPFTLDYSPRTRDVFDLEQTKKQHNIDACSSFLGRTVAACLDEIGDGIDMLILDAAEVMPWNLLDFISALPYLSPDAVVVLCDTLPDNPAGNVLFQNVTADMASAHLASCLDIGSCIRFAATDIVSAFQITPGTSKAILDLFVALRCSWSCIPPLVHLLEYEASIKAHYDSTCLELYRQAVLASDPYKIMLKSVLESVLDTFPQVLLYGKGNRGRYFLKLSGMLGIHVTGVVVSDGRSPERTYENLPVYSYSQIPFSRDEVFIFQTVSSEEIERQLRQSGFHWMNLPKSFWLDCDHNIQLLTSG